MRIRWARVITAFALIFGLAFLALHTAAIGQFLESVRMATNEHTPGGRLRSFMSFGLICVVIVAIVKILADSNRK